MVPAPDTPLARANGDPPALLALAPLLDVPDAHGRTTLPLDLVRDLVIARRTLHDKLARGAAATTATAAAAPAAARAPSTFDVLERALAVRQPTDAHNMAAVVLHDDGTRASVLSEALTVQAVCALLGIGRVVTTHERNELLARECAIFHARIRRVPYAECVRIARDLLDADTLTLPLPSSAATDALADPSAAAACVWHGPDGAPTPVLERAADARAVIERELAACAGRVGVRGQDACRNIARTLAHGAVRVFSAHDESGERRVLALMRAVPDALHVLASGRALAVDGVALCDVRDFLLAQWRRVRLQWLDTLHTASMVTMVPLALSQLRSELFDASDAANHTGVLSRQAVLSTETWVPPCLVAALQQIARPSHLRDAPRFTTSRLLHSSGLPLDDALALVAHYGAGVDNLAAVVDSVRRVYDSGKTIEPLCEKLAQTTLDEPSGRVFCVFARRGTAGSVDTEHVRRVTGCDDVQDLEDIAAQPNARAACACAGGRRSHEPPFFAPSNRARYVRHMPLVFRRRDADADASAAPGARAAVLGVRTASVPMSRRARVEQHARRKRWAAK